MLFGCVVNFYDAGVATHSRRIGSGYFCQNRIKYFTYFVLTTTLSQHIPMYTLVQLKGNATDIFSHIQYYSVRYQFHYVKAAEQKPNCQDSRQF
jgi:hypothetical protein